MRIVVAGALGEVGRSVTAALVQLGHEVTPVTSRSQASDAVVLPIDQALHVIASGGTDLVVNASGRGDKREADRDPSAAAELLARACEDAGVPGILVSTVRVLEDATTAVSGSADPICHTEYARANAINERLWLSAAPTWGRVVRLANYFCAPVAVASPQTSLLPWSLVMEATDEGRIAVRSSPSVSREFVSAHDVANALMAVGTDASPSRVTSTIPGLRLDMGQLAECVCEAFQAVGLSRPDVTFGSEHGSGPRLLPDWLAEHGWESTLTAAAVTEVVAAWLSEHGSIQQ